jgi:hypothetical protein
MVCYAEDKFRFRTSDGSVYSLTSITKNVWQHWVITYDYETKTKKIYLNGNLDNNGTSSLDFIYSGNFFLGDTDITSAYYKGNMDELSIYNKVLSESEIKSLYNNNIGMTPPFSQELLNYNTTTIQETTTRYLYQHLGTYNLNYTALNDSGNYVNYK